MRLLITWGVCLLASLARGQELLQNGGFESLDHWDCYSPFKCSLTTDKHSGDHAMLVENRDHYYQGPSQDLTVTQGGSYVVSGYIKLQNDLGASQNLELEIDFEFPELTRVRIYYQGPKEGVNFIVDEMSVTPDSVSTSNVNLDSEIDRLRKSNINIQVTGANSGADVKIRVLQKKKSFPFGTAVAAWAYNDGSKAKYRDFIHQHFNWAVPENALKWPTIEPQRGQKNYEPALTMINGLRSHGIKVRGHNLVWSVDQFVQDWVKALHGDELRQVVKDHIGEAMSRTKGLLEHWDVNNENLHGQFFQNQLNDPSYNLELFRIAHAADPQPKLFLNDYNVVASGGSTYDYREQAKQFKAANVGLYGIGVQCHFGNEELPDAGAIRRRLDVLAEAGVPIWATELDVQAADENRRADFYEAALTALYSHPSVEGILFWGFWDKAHWRGDSAALVAGDNVQLTAAGRRVLELFEKRWMTDETHTVAESGTKFTVRGFHGDYEVQITQGGRTQTQTFTLGKSDQTVNISL
ncbi:hypothetical protein C0Q70_14048 [Pomacea canaliculata]|uniref:GH10 domain-containing protein n=1 Tax=Pomacea canaliculata TaxID=400727 RepID=A0A2T7NYX9_POMCA|nr:hypothetical protein C0Q70_14048 [Pomacea canaliculata]